MERKMKKILYLASLFFLFSAPSIVSAEEADLSNLSEEEMLQELNKRHEERLQEESKVREQVEETKEEAKTTYSDQDAANMDEVYQLNVKEFKEEAESFSIERLQNIHDAYEVKGELTSADKEKLDFVNETIDEKLDTTTNLILSFGVICSAIFLISLIVAVVDNRH